MQDNKKVVIGIVGIILIGLLAGLVLSFSPLKKTYIKRQLQKMYGVTFTDVEGSNIYKASNGKNYVFQTTDNGITTTTVGTCNFFGKIKTDSYIHYYYADECKQYIQDEIGSCFDDCVVIVNDDANDLYNVKLKVDDIASYEDYLEALKASEDCNGKKSVIVYVREAEDLKHLTDADTILEKDSQTYRVDYYMVPDDFFDELKESGIYCYGFSDAEYKLIDSQGEENASRFQDYKRGIGCQMRWNEQEKEWQK